MTPVSPEEWRLWQANNVTKAFMAKVAELREEGLEELAAGVHTMDSNRTYLLVGKLNALTQILRAEFKEDN